MPVPARVQPYLYALVVCLVLAALGGFELMRERQRMLDHARSDTANMARLLEAHLRQSLRRVEDLLADAEARIDHRDSGLSGPEGRARVERQLSALLPSDRLVSAVVWLDPAQQPLAQSGAEGGAAGSADGMADLLTRMREPGDLPIVLGRLWRGPNGTWQMPVGRRVTLGDGKAGGTLIAWVDLGSLQQVLDTVDTGRNGFVTLFRRDGWMLATAPRNEALFSRHWADTPMFTQHLPKAPTGTVQQVVVRDNTERVYSYRALSDYPVVVSVGISLTEAQAVWLDQLRRDGLLLLVVAGALAAGAAVASGLVRRRLAAERQSAEAALQTQSIVEHAADGIVLVGSDGRVLSANPAASTMFGHAAADLVGMPVHTLLPGLPRTPSDTAPEGEPEAQPSADGNVGLRGDGRRFPAEWSVTEASRDGQALRIVLVRDITERRRAQAEVAQARDTAERSERFLRAITDNLPLGIAYVDRELRFRFVNRVHCLRFQRPREAIIGHTREELTGRPLPPEMDRRLAAVMQGQAQRFEFEETDEPGSPVIESYLVPDIGPDGQVVGIYAARSDVSERHAQQRRLEVALAERDTLLREVYHRVKNNLQVVQSLLNLQRRTLPPGPARAALDESVQRVHAMALVHEKLYQSGDLQAVSPREYLADLLRHLGDLAGVSWRHITLASEIDLAQASLEVAVPLGLLVTELVGNSLKHGFPEGRGGRVTVTLRREPDGVWLRVHDDGVGLPDDFDLERAPSMGLQLASSLALQLGGTLQVSRQGGTTFSALLPRLD